MVASHLGDTPTGDRWLGVDQLTVDQLVCRSLY